MIFSIDDFIGIFDFALSTEDCNGLIEDFEENYKLNLHYKRGQHSNFSSTEIDDDSVDYAIVDADSPFIFRNRSQAYNLSLSVGQCLQIYSKKFGDFKYLDSTYFSSVKVQRTMPGQGYHVWHCEQSSREQAHKLLFYIVYLNDVEEGGETEFLYYSKRIKPQTGRILIAPASFTHTHRGNPPLSGAKYIATGWIEW